MTRTAWREGSRRLVWLSVMLLGVMSSAASAHSASDAYLTLDPGQPGKTTVQVQWDIALRDLDFVMKLDDDGDGRIVWKELRRHQQQIARYALAHIGFGRNGKACRTKLAKQEVDNHADGAYAALFVDVSCDVTRDTARDGPATPITLDYRLFFTIDPSHRAILVSRNGGDVATALLSPQNAHVDLKVGDAPRPDR